MLRLLMKIENSGDLQAGGHIQTDWRTVDIDAPAAEVFLRRGPKSNPYVTVEVIGVEVLPEDCARCEEKRSEP